METQTSSQKLLKQLKRQIIEWNEQRKWFKAYGKDLDKTGFDFSFFGGRIDFNNLKHEQIVHVMKVLKLGKWTKTSNYNGTTIDYAADFHGKRVCCYAGEPPPNCKIVEVEVEVPAIPAHTVKKNKLVCVEKGVPVTV